MSEWGEEERIPWNSHSVSFFSFHSAYPSFFSAASLTSLNHILIPNDVVFLLLFVFFFVVSGCHGFQRGVACEARERHVHQLLRGEKPRLLEVQPRRSSQRSNSSLRQCRSVHFSSPILLFIYIYTHIYIYIEIKRWISSRRDLFMIFNPPIVLSIFSNFIIEIMWMN